MVEVVVDKLGLVDSLLLRHGGDLHALGLLDVRNLLDIRMVMAVVGAWARGQASIIRGSGTPRGALGKRAWAQMATEMQRNAVARNAVATVLPLLCNANKNDYTCNAMQGQILSIGILQWT